MRPVRILGHHDDRWVIEDVPVRELLDLIERDPGVACHEAEQVARARRLLHVQLDPGHLELEAHPLCEPVEELPLLDHLGTFRRIDRGGAY